MTNTMTRDEPNRDLEGLLPWYVNGTISADERAAIDAWLAEDANARLLLDAMREESDITAEANAEIVVPDTRAGLESLMAAIDAEAPVKRATATRAAVEPRQGLMARLAGWLPTPGHRLAAGLAGVLVVAQAAAIAVMLSGGPGENTDTVQPGFQVASGGEASAVGPRFIVMFPEEMTVADVTGFLAEQRMHIVGGPRSGMFEIALTAETPDEAAIAAAERILQSEAQVQFIGRAE